MAAQNLSETSNLGTLSERQGWKAVISKASKSLHFLVRKK